MQEKPQVCPGCRKQCDLTAPRCSVGKKFAKTGILPLTGKHGKHKLEGCHVHGLVSADIPRHSHHHPHHGECRGPLGDFARQDAPQGVQGEPPTPEERLIGHLHRLSHALRHGAESRGGQGRLLLLLYKAGGLSQHELMELVDVRAGSLSEVLGKLAESGLIERTQNAEDRRRIDITLTEAGAQAAMAEEARVNANRRGLFGTLTDEEQAQLIALLEKLSTDWDVQGRDMHRHHSGHDSHGCEGHDGHHHGCDGHEGHHHGHSCGGHDGYDCHKHKHKHKHRHH
jgi:DNA-binding MarR family transcriptional regulator